MSKKDLIMILDKNAPILYCIVSVDNKNEDGSYEISVMDCEGLGTGDECEYVTENCSTEDFIFPDEEQPKWDVLIKEIESGIKKLPVELY